MYSIGAIMRKKFKLFIFTLDLLTLVAIKNSLNCVFVPNICLWILNIACIKNKGKTIKPLSHFSSSEWGLIWEGLASKVRHHYV